MNDMGKPRLMLNPVKIDKSLIAFVYSIMAFSKTDWKNLIWTPVVLLVSAGFQFSRHRPEIGFLFVAISVVILIVIYIQLLRK
jgi:uncharacterized membrane protein